MRSYFFTFVRVFFAALRFDNPFLLRFRIFPEVMLFAGTAENKHRSGNGSGDFAEPKMHNALAN